MVNPSRMIQHLRQHMPIARAGRDPEGVHQLRVASRRLRVWLHLAGRRTLGDDLRWFRNAAGEVRDLDVLLGLKPPQPFAAWLRAERRAARGRFRVTLDSARTEGLLQALDSLPPITDARARKALPKLAKRVRKRARALELDHPPIDELHALRKSVRVLRYGLEWLRRRTRLIKRFQDTLGWLGDLRVSQSLFDAWPERDSLPGYAAQTEERMVAGVEAMKGAWPAARRHVEALL